MYRALVQDVSGETGTTGGVWRPSFKNRAMDEESSGGPARAPGVYVPVHLRNRVPGAQPRYPFYTSFVRYSLYFSYICYMLPQWISNVAVPKRLRPFVSPISLKRHLRKILRRCSNHLVLSPASSSPKIARLDFLGVSFLSQFPRSFPNSRSPRFLWIGYAFVSFLSRQHAQAAMDALDGKGWDYLILAIEWAKYPPLSLSLSRSRYRILFDCSRPLALIAHFQTFQNELKTRALGE